MVPGLSGGRQKGHLWPYLAIFGHRQVFYPIWVEHRLNKPPKTIICFFLGQNTDGFPSTPPLSMIFSGIPHSTIFGAARNWPITVFGCILLYLGVLSPWGQCIWTPFCMTFSGIPHSTIFCAARNRPIAVFCCIWLYLSVFGYFCWPCKIWSYKMEFRHIDLRAIGPPSKKTTKTNFGSILAQNC